MMSSREVFSVGGIPFLNIKWQGVCEQYQGTAPEITGPPVGYDEGMKQVGCK